MKHYQVCKYDKSRDGYLGEWTRLEQLLHSSADTDQPRQAIPEEYLAVEKTYLEFATNYFSALTCDRALIIVDFLAEGFHKHHSEYPHLHQGTIFYGPRVHENVKEGASVSILEAVYMVQLTLRQITGAKFRIGSEAYLGCGDDLYLLIGLPDSIDIESLMPAGRLFYYESDRDPYM